jgi:hypothetical protein
MFKDSVFNMIIGIISFFICIIIVFQILRFMEIPTKYVFDYTLFFVSLGLLYIFLPKSSIKWA